MRARLVRAGAALAVLCALAGGLLPAARAGQERYDYDPLGRLVRHTDAAGTVTDYQYDPAGNILSVRRAGAGALAPLLESVTPSLVRRGQARSLVLSGQRLQVGTLRAADPGLDLSNVRQSPTQVKADLSVGEGVPLGRQVLTFSNAQGASSLALTIGPSLPALSVEPSPLALPPDNTVHAVTLRLSAPDVVDHDISVTSSDASRVTASPTRVTIPAGQSSALLQVLPRANGFASLALTSPLLAPASLPVFVTTDFRGVNTSRAPPVGVRLGPIKTDPAPVVSATLGAPRVGLVRGPLLARLVPQGLPVGSSASLLIEGRGLPPGLRVSVSPGEGVSFALTASSATQLALAVTAQADAVAGARRIVVTTAEGVPIPFADPQQALFTLTTGQPVIDSIDPLFASPGQRVTLRLRGRHLQQGQLALLPGVDLAVDAQPTLQADGRELVAALQVDPLAQPGPRLVQVITPSGASDAAASSANQFTVVRAVREGISPIASPLVGVRLGAAAEAGPSVSATWLAPKVGVTMGVSAVRASPPVGVLGTSLTLEVAGTGLQAVTGVSLLPGDGLALGALQVSPDGTRLSLPVAVAADAPRTLRRVVLSLASGTLVFSAPDGDQFLVAAPSPVLESVTPQVVAAGQAVTMQLRGRNFSDVQGVRFEPSAGLTAGAPFTTAAGGTQLSFQLRVAADAASGERTVIVQSAGGESAATALPGNSFRVATQAGPVRDAIAAPMVGVQRGAGAASPATEARAMYSSLVGVAFAAAAAPQPESRQAAAPSVGVVIGATATSLQPRSPDGFLAGSSGTLTLSGQGLDRITGVRIVGAAGVSAGVPVAGADGRTLTVPLTVGSAAPSGAYAVRLLADPADPATPVTPAGRDGLLFNVGALPAAIDSVSPIVLEQGKAYQLVVRGRGLKDVFEVQAEPSGGLAFGMAFTSPAWATDALGESLTVRVAVEPSATPGPRVIRLRVPGGLSRADPVPATTVNVVAPQSGAGP